MSAHERAYQHLRAQLAELDSLLSITPVSAVIDRSSLEYRKSQILKELEANPAPHRWPASARLVFNGKPVVDREGIYADFAGVAIDAFSKTVTALAASQQTVLGERGVIPHRDDYRLTITGISRGSFGFDVEEVPDPQLSYIDEESPVEWAIGQTKGILSSLLSDEEEIADAIADTDERALDALRDFLKVMADKEAVCALSFKNAVVRFGHMGQIQRGLAHLHKNNIQEGGQEFLGSFQGFLPRSRKAEFINEAGEVLLCTIDRTVENAETINLNLGIDVRVTARFRKVGQARPRYTILGYRFPQSHSLVTEAQNET